MLVRERQTRAGHVRPNLTNLEHRRPQRARRPVEGRALCPAIILRALRTLDACAPGGAQAVDAGVKVTMEQGEGDTRLRIRVRHRVTRVAPRLHLRVQGALLLGGELPLERQDHAPHLGVEHVDLVVVGGRFEFGFGVMIGVGVGVGVGVRVRHMFRVGAGVKVRDMLLRLQ